MPKMTRPDGRTVSVSRQGVEALQARGYTLLGPGDGISSAQGATPAPAPAEPTPAEEIESTAPERPAKSATKPEWVAYAESQGVENADELTKDELIERFG